LWEILGEDDNAAFNRRLIAELEKFAADPEEYMRKAQENQQRENP